MKSLSEWVLPVWTHSPNQTDPFNFVIQSLTATPVTLFHPAFQYACAVLAFDRIYLVQEAMEP